MLTTLCTDKGTGWGGSILSRLQDPCRYVDFPCHCGVPRHFLLCEPTQRNRKLIVYSWANGGKLGAREISPGGGSGPGGLLLVLQDTCFLPDLVAILPSWLWSAPRLAKVERGRTVPCLRVGQPSRLQAFAPQQQLFLMFSWSQPIRLLSFSSFCFWLCL